MSARAKLAKLRKRSSKKEEVGSADVRSFFLRVCGICGVKPNDLKVEELPSTTFHRRFKVDIYGPIYLGGVCALPGFERIISKEFHLRGDTSRLAEVGHSSEVFESQERWLGVAVEEAVSVRFCSRFSRSRNRTCDIAVHVDPMYTGMNVTWSASGHQHVETTLDLDGFEHAYSVVMASVIEQEQAVSLDQGLTAFLGED